MADKSRPAFPSDFAPGMTMLQYYAGQALPVVFEAMRREPAFDPERSLRLVAKAAFIVAEAMVAESEAINTR